MKKIVVQTQTKQLLADIHTPVGIYLRLRDRFRDTILLESTDHHSAENSYSFICINAIAGFEVDARHLEYKLPAQKPEKLPLNGQHVPTMLQNFMQRFEPGKTLKEGRFALGLYGYTSYDAVQFFEPVAIRSQAGAIPLMRYRLYQYVIVINHFRDEMTLCENVIAGLDSEMGVVESLIKSRDVPQFPFDVHGAETSNLQNEDYLQMVQQGIKSCYRGDVFQVVLSRRFQQPFTGDEFNVYRALRSINPSPYLFYFDYGDYKLMGSSPESQVVISNGKAIVHPIAGTYKRTGDDVADKLATQHLVQNEKENAEHVMLVDLARNDLSRHCTDVQVERYKEVQYYSHVIHLVSEVTGKLKPGTHAFDLLAGTFPAGTLSGAPKVKAMQFIAANEPDARGYYGGALGFIGFDGSCNHAIMIRTFLSRNNTLYYQAGAGVVAASNPESELQEVNNKLGALKKAIEKARTVGR
jgi:anthranilate synthase component 1